MIADSFTDHHSEGSNQRRLQRCCHSYHFFYLHPFLSNSKIQSVFLYFLLNSLCLGKLKIHRGYWKNIGLQFVCGSLQKLLPFGQDGTDNCTTKRFDLGLPVFLPERLQAKAGSIIYLSHIFIFYENVLCWVAPYR